MTVTTAPWLPPPAATPVLPYKRFDRTGRALSPGSYAFLDGAGQAVTTYEGLRDGTVTGLRIHQVDADGTSRADSFGAAAVGDVFEWRQAEDCWVRYQVTSLLPDPAGSAPRKRFAISWVTYAGTGCSGGRRPVHGGPRPVASDAHRLGQHHVARAPRAVRAAPSGLGGANSRRRSRSRFPSRRRARLRRAPMMTPSGHPAISPSSDSIRCGVNRTCRRAGPCHGHKRRTAPDSPTAARGYS